MDVGAAVALGLDDRVPFQQLVSLRDGLAVELEIVGELADRGQRITRLQNASRDCSLDLLDQLLELRHGVVEVDGDFHRRRRSSAPMYHLSPWYIWLIGDATSGHENR